MFINSKTITTATIIALAASTGTAFSMDGNGPLPNVQIEYQEDDQDNASERRRLPALNDIPNVGTLFNSRDRTTTRSQLVIQIQPDVVRGR